MWDETRLVQQKVWFLKLLWRHSFWLLQRGLDASGLQRAGDRQEGGGKEDSEPGRQEERAGRETGHGLRQQEVASQHKHCFVIIPRSEFWGRFLHTGRPECKVHLGLRLRFECNNHRGVSSLNVFPVSVLCLTQWCQRCRWLSRKLLWEPSPPLAPNWTCLMSQVSPLDPQSTCDTFSFICFSLNQSASFDFVLVCHWCIVFDVSDIRTTRLQWETVLDPGGIPMEGPPPLPHPGLWRKRTRKRRSPSLVFSQLERGISTDVHARTCSLCLLSFPSVP